MAPEGTDCVTMLRTVDFLFTLLGKAKVISFKFTVCFLYHV